MPTLDAILQESARLHTSLNLIQNLQLAAQSTPSQLQSELQNVRDAAESIARYLVACEKRAAAPHDVLHSPELLERILIHHDSKMLLDVTEIDHAFSAVVHQSTRLRQKVFVQADDRTHFTPLVEVDSIFNWPFELTIEPDRCEGVEKFPRSYKLWFENDPGREFEGPVEHNSRNLPMLVCQPPIYEVTGRWSCGCYPGPSDHDSIDKTARSSTGITTRDLIGLARVLQEANHLCKGMRLHEEEDWREGRGDWLEDNITFEAPISLQEDDPILEPIKRERGFQAQLDSRR
ncbi:hypothetical protein LTR95_001999 [Oleoguttula sp. CCFEE 5521]